MKRLLYILILSFGAASCAAQSVPGYFAPIASPYDYQWLRTRYLRLPTDTLSGADVGAIAYKNGAVYVKSSYWTALGAGGGGGTYFAGYGLTLASNTFKADTTLLASKAYVNALPVGSVTSTNITNWNDAYSWGNHASVGYLTEEVDPKRVISAAFSGTTTKTLTLGLADASTLTASFSDLSGGSSSGTDSAAYHTVTMLPDSSGYTISRPNGTRDTVQFVGEELSGATVDTASLSNRINLKQAITDTSTVDATRYWVGQQGYAKQSALQDTASALRAAIGSGTVTSPPQSKAITIESPTPSENITLFYTTRAITLTDLHAYGRGSSFSVSYGIYHAADRSSGTPQTVYTSTLSGTTAASGSATTFTDATIPAGSWVWLTTTASTGVTSELALTLTYSVD